MDALIGTFHIDYKILIAQIVNFSIVLFVLYKFAYGPLVKVMNDRTEKIEKGLRDAKEANKKLTETEEREKEVLSKARKEAQAIIEVADKTALKNKEDLLNEAKKKSEEIVANTQKQLEEEKKKMMSEVKSEIANLVVAATGKVIDEKMDSGKDREIIKKAIE
ncbi:MAG: F0F1 ATP synthase subunit B [Parcubacteria group bacterium]|jgi:F-type H+-transporting ATPase subunit b